MKLTAENQNEIWKAIPGFDNYEVSNIGNVRRIDGTQMKIFKTANGYMRVGLRANGIRSQLLVHRLVLSAFVGPCPDGKQVNHIDEDRSNNNLYNLEYVTAKENINYGSCIEKGVSKRVKAVAQYSLDNVFITSFPSIKAASQFSGVSSENICSCCRGGRPFAGGFRWTYFDGGKQ